MEKISPIRFHCQPVPWHDTAWDGRVCANPNLNSSCLKLKRNCFLVALSDQV